MVNVGEDHLQQFVSENGAPVGKAKQRVVCEDCSDSQRPGMEDSLVTQSTECLQRKNVTRPCLETESCSS